MSARPKPIIDSDERRRQPKQSGVKRVDVREDAEPDPFAEFHDGWEPVRKRKSGPPSE